MYGRARLQDFIPWNVIVGIALSLVLHILLALWVEKMNLSAKQTQQVQNHTLEVRLLRELPPLPPPMPPARVESKVEPQIIAHAKPAHHSAPTQRQTLPIATNESPSAPAIVPSAPQVPPEKHLDMDALHANLRAILAESDREKRDTPVGQLQEKPLYPPDEKSKLGKAISNTTRPDCRDNIANTGLLAPLFLLAMAADKKDSGCKW